VQHLVWAAWRALEIEIKSIAEGGGVWASVRGEEAVGAMGVVVQNNQACDDVKSMNGQLWTFGR
jgi:hypothetical protein